METTLQKQTLYNIRQDHYELIKMIEDADGELTPEIEQALQLNEKDFQDKARSYGFVIKEYENTELIIDNEIQRLKNLMAKSKHRQELFKNILSEAMQERGIENIETPMIKLSFRKSEAVEITDERMIPAEFTTSKTVVDISKIKIKEALKKGGSVQGAQLVTRQNLQIK